MRQHALFLYLCVFISCRPAVEEQDGFSFYRSVNVNKTIIKDNVSKPQ